MPKARVKVKSSLLISLLVLSVIIFGLVIALLLVQRAQIFSPSAKKGESTKASAHKVLTNNGQCLGCGNKDCPVVEQKGFDTFSLCKSFINAGAYTDQIDSKNRKWTVSKCQPQGNKSYYWICYCHCSTPNYCDNCQ